MLHLSDMAIAVGLVWGSFWLKVRLKLLVEISNFVIAPIEVEL